MIRTPAASDLLGRIHLFVTRFALSSSSVDMSFGRTPWLTLLTVVPLLTNTVRAESSREVNVFSYLTDDGRKIATPTPASPAYYLLINGGYQEMGDLVEGEKSPDAAPVQKFVRKALAGNYFSGVAQTSPPLCR